MRVFLVHSENFRCSVNREFCSLEAVNRDFAETLSVDFGATK